MVGPPGIVEVDAVLGLLATELDALLGRRLFGLYLYGSLAIGDFDRATSDIDFLVVTTDELDSSDHADIEAMHDRVWSRGGPWAQRLEGSYLPLSELPVWRNDGTLRAWVNEGKFFLRPHHDDWVIQRHVLREHGVIVSGPPIAALLEPVDAAALRDAVRGILGSWWAARVDDPAILRSPPYQRFAVLTMCRALHALDHGEIASKPVAARWAAAHLGPPWTELIERALAARTDPTQDEHDLTLELVSRVVASAREHVAGL